MTMRGMVCEELRNAGFVSTDGVWRNGTYWVYEYKVYKTVERKGGTEAAVKPIADLLDPKYFEQGLAWIRKQFRVHEKMELHDQEVLIRVDGRLYLLACFDSGKGYDAWLDRKQVWDNRNKLGDKVKHVDNILRKKFGDNVNYWKIWMEAMFYCKANKVSVYDVK